MLKHRESLDGRRWIDNYSNHRKGLSSMGNPMALEPSPRGDRVVFGTGVCVFSVLVGVLQGEPFTTVGFYMSNEMAEMTAYKCG